MSHRCPAEFLKYQPFFYSSLRRSLFMEKVFLDQSPQALIWGIQMGHTSVSQTLVQSNQYRLLSLILRI
jgi:hypothetical protein